MLAFLNCCQTAEGGQSGSFLDVLHSFGFTGAIATEQQTIDNFANELGLAFLRGFLQEGRPLGELLHGLRLSMAPLGLLYGAHCPPEIHVKIGEQVTGAAQPAIQEFGRVSGVSLQAPGRGDAGPRGRAAARAARSSLIARWATLTAPTAPCSPVATPTSSGSPPGSTGAIRGS